MPDVDEKSLASSMFYNAVSSRATHSTKSQSTLTLFASLPVLVSDATEEGSSSANC